MCRVPIPEGFTSLSNVQNTLRKPRRTECVMTIRIFGHHTEEIAYELSML